MCWVALDRAMRLAQRRSLPGDIEHCEKMLSYSNEVGLFSEQVGDDGQFLGNVPQAFTHLALVSGAFDLNRWLDGHK